MFGQIGLGHFFGKIDYSYFCQSIVSHHTRMFKLKRVFRENHEIKDFVILVKIGTKLQACPYWVKE